MQVKHLTVTAFTGVPSFDATLAGLTLITGPNHSGKTSLLEALRFALTGEVDRVKLKKDFPLLVTDGATKARVSITLDDGELITGLLPTGKHLNPIMPNTPGAYALDPTRFMRLKEDERRTLLYDLSGDQGDVVKIARDRLIAQKVPAAMIDAVLPSLRIGFPEAFAQASARVTEARTSWRAIASETYGVQKAEGWRPSTPVTLPTEDELAAAREELAEAKLAVTDAAERIGQMQATLDPEQRRTLTAQAEPLSRFRANLADGEAALAKLKEDQLALTETAAQVSGLCFDCPSCQALLRYAAGVVSLRTVEVEEASAANAELQRLSRDIATTEQKVGTVRARVTAAQAAADRLAAAGEEGQEDDTGLRTAMAEAEQRLDDAHAALAALEQRARHVAELDKKAADAAVWHDKAKGWAEVATLFAPDGLPNELLGWALKPVNDALRDGPAGFPIVQIRGDMTLTVGGRPYLLCSESEQWRADVMLATWMAERAGTGMVLVDRMDVLDPGSRAPFIEWMADRADAGTHQFIAAGTFNSAPAIDYATVYWLGAPVLVQAA